MKAELVGTPYIIDQQEGHNYNLDSILLANFINSIPKDIKEIYDLGTGQGVLMFYLSLKTKARLIGYDIQINLIELAKKNIKHNELMHQIHAEVKDIKEMNVHQAQMIVSNPPYFKVTENIPLSETISRSIARHEIKITLEELLEKVSQSLRTKGVFYMSYRPDRLSELVLLSKKHQLALKIIQCVHPYVDKEAHLLLLKFVKGGNDGVKILNPLILYQENGKMTFNLEKIYKGEQYATFNT
jgi:tRNA1(Val) A37 N6-methylase TrmN6